MAKNRTQDAEAKVAEASANVDNAATATPAAEAPEADADADVEYDYVVIKTFKDKNDVEKKVKEPRIYKAGETVNRFGEERLNDLISRKLVEKRAK